MNITFAERLTELMLEKEMSNQEFAGALNINIATVQRWKRGGKYLLLSQLIRIADYFNCSLDFLLGRSDTVLDYVPQTCPDFFPRFRYVLAEKGKSRYLMDKETKIKDSYFTTWAKGTEPHALSLVQIADYLNCSTDYLVGRDK